MITRWAGLALVLLGVLAIVRHFRGEKEQPFVSPAIMPAFGACADCNRMVPVTIQGRCSMCGSSSVVMPWSDGARLTLKDNAAREQALERRRFRRGGLAS